MTALRVLVVAADPLARAGLASMLAGQDRVTLVGQADAADEALHVLRVFRPDTAVCDAGWSPGAARASAAAYEEQGIPVLALVADALVAAEWWGSGVHGVLERTAAPSQIISALLAIREGLRVLAPSFAPAAQRRAESIAAPLESLTPREIEVLHLMADGLSNKLIARDLSISENTVKFHVNAILSKLDAQSRTDAVVRATRMGILLL